MSKEGSERPELHMDPLGSAVRSQVLLHGQDGREGKSGLGAS